MKKERNADQLVLDLLGSTPRPTYAKQHQFKHHKQLPLPKSPQKGKPINHAQVFPQKSKRVSFEQKYCIPNQKYPLLYLEAFKQRHVASNCVIERWIATRNLKLLSIQMQQWISSQLSQKVHPLKQEEHPFYQLIEKREERHFQVDRIIKYLSNF